MIPVAGVGSEACLTVDAADTAVNVGDEEFWMLMSGRRLTGRDRRVLSVVATQAAGLVKQGELAEEAGKVQSLAEADELRRLLLSALGHDLRTPLTAAKAAASSLRAEDVWFSPEDTSELLATVEESVDQLTLLVANLLDSSRLAAGVVRPELTEVYLEEVVQRALVGIGGRNTIYGRASIDRVKVEVGGTVAMGDAGLLERVLSNVIDNALRYAPDKHGAGQCGTGRTAGVDQHHRRGTGSVQRCRGRDVPTVPAARRFRHDHRSGPRPVGGQGIRRSNERHYYRERYPRWRADYPDRSGRAAAGPARERRGDERGAAQMTRVLVVDDDPQLLRALRINLSVRGYEVITAPTGSRALALAAEHPPQVVILDLGMPDISGIEVLAGLRGWLTAPVIVLSARTDSSDKVGALDAGADDYMTKPFGMDELLARLRAAVRRAAVATGADNPVVETKSFLVDLSAKRVIKNGEEVHLTPTEWGMLEMLVRNRGKLVGREELLREVWGPKYAKETHYLRVFLAQLRRKLEDDPSHPAHLLTEAGMGYRFEA